MRSLDEDEEKQIKGMKCIKEELLMNINSLKMN